MNKKSQNSLLNRIYKAITVDKSKWVYGYYYPKYINDEIHHYITDGKTDTEVIAETVCQFTTKYDKNKTPIYENDIIKSYVEVTDTEEFDHKFYRMGIIRFVAAKFALSNVECYKEIDWDNPYYIPDKRTTFDYPAYRSEIISNKFDSYISKHV